MATTEWSATFETTPAGNTSRKLGDDRIRELKLAIRERLQKGGHYMQDSAATFPKDGRHVIGVGDGPDIYRSDASTVSIDYADTVMTVRAGTALVVEDGIAQSSLKFNVATKGADADASIVGVAPGATSTALLAAPISIVLGTTKGILAVWAHVNLEAVGGACDKFNFFVQIDYLNDGTWTDVKSTGNLLVLQQTAATTGMMQASLCFIDPLTSPSDGGTVNIRLKAVNSHGTISVNVQGGNLTVIELRR